MSADTGAEWKHSILGCFQDCRLCIWVFCVPMYATGKNAESLGEECLPHALSFNLPMNAIMRYRIRKQRNIQGSMLTDVFVHCLLPCCALMQEAREIGYGAPSDIAIIGTSQDKMARE